MPSYSGRYSWMRLVNTIYKAQPNSYGVNKIAGWPLSLMNTGIYLYTGGNNPGGYIDDLTIDGNWWSLTGKTSTGSYYLSATDQFISLYYATGRGYGTAIRCVVRS